MSNSKEQSILSVFRLLTPERVETYSNASQEIPLKKVSGGESFSEEETFLSGSHEAKILPFFNPGVSTSHESEGEKNVPDTTSNHNDSEESSSDFLLNERNKSRLSSRKLLEGEARKLYQAGANLEFCEPNDEGEESQAVDPKGVLVNKKHP